MSLSLLPNFLLVPPANLLVPALAGVALVRCRPALARLLLGLGLGGLLLTSLPYCAGWLLVSLEAGLPLAPPRDIPPQAIVILSADVVPTQAGLELGALTLERERAGATLAARTGLPVLVTGGTLADGPPSLGALMAASLARDFHCQVRWTEAAAQDTRENARFSTVMLRADGVGSIYLVTHAWHMRRALRAFAGSGITVTAAPVRMDVPPRLRAGAFVPTAHAWLISYYALHEWIGVLGSSLGVR